MFSKFCAVETSIIGLFLNALICGLHSSDFYWHTIPQMSSSPASNPPIPISMKFYIMEANLTRLQSNSLEIGFHCIVLYFCISFANVNLKIMQLWCTVQWHLFLVAPILAREKCPIFCCYSCCYCHLSLLELSPLVLLWNNKWSTTLGSNN